MTQKFKVGDRVQFVYNNENEIGIIKSTTINGKRHCIKTENGECMKSSIDLAPAPALVVVPKCVDDFFERYPKIDGHTLHDLLSDLLTSRDSADADVYDWIMSNNSVNGDLMARAWLDGYEVEEEPLYYVKVLNRGLGYLNCDTGTGGYFIDSRNNEDGIKTQYTETEIKALNEKLWECAVPVEEGEG
ncbi:DUF1642 domain-containing protein [Listeria booriae]|uniref:DUF1642 domain-containing protein n=1 Tax=Listeria booriae TaxID=1552123 RepID=UPI00164DDC4C|nr:DUF1642 domain-containing protein [Listeria booriae]MBC6163319.1 DUF1642 domain-containing protein [Listeria booriae]